jgi:hypothetical protein
MRSILVVLSLLLVACGGQAESTSDRTWEPNRSPGRAAEARTGPVNGHGPATARCVEEYSPATLANRTFAFDGTVMAIGPAGTNKPGKGDLDAAAVAFTVNEWFAGGTAPTVTVDLMSPASNIVGDVTPAYEEGTRLLVSGEPRWGGEMLDDAIAWTCGGFTRYYESPVAAEWRSATG